MVTPDAKRDAVAHACLVHGVSQRRACEALAVDRSSVRYRSLRPDDRELREAMKALRQKVTSEADYVGEKFAEEARKIHFGEADARGIYGEATLEEAKSLAEDGVGFMPIPVFPEDRN